MSWRVLLAAMFAAALSSTATAAVPSACPGREIDPDRVITGAFGEELFNSYVMLPFEVPKGTTAVRVKYCWDQPANRDPLTQQVLDLGLYEPPVEARELWGEGEFRGWGGSRVLDATVSAEGFSSDALWKNGPREEEPGKTSRSFVPGDIPAGRWAIELGVAAVAPAAIKPDGVAWRVEVELSDDPAYADEPYRPAAYDSTPARREPGWYAGDFHVHAEHSTGSLIRDVADYAFKPLEDRGAGLDFFTLSEYVTTSHLGEIGRHQARYPGRLIARSAEVITYRGHLQNHNGTRFVDYRTTPVYERRDDGSLVLRRGNRPAADLLDAVRDRGGYTQVNHPTLYPPPAFRNFCRGCAWDYDDALTDYSKVDAVEIANGPQNLKAEPKPGPNPFTVTALDFYEEALQRNPGIAAVAGSDNKTGGQVAPPTNPQGYVTQTPVGEPAAVVYAEELSEAGIECGVEAGHSFVKATGAGAPDLRFEARPVDSSAAPAIMGDTVRAGRAELTARVLGGAPDPEVRQLVVLRDGSPVRSAAVTGHEFALRFEEATPGRYSLLLQRGPTIEAVSSPIRLVPGPGEIRRRDCRPLRVRGLALRRSRVARRRFHVACRASGGTLRACRVKAQAFTSARRWRAVGRASVRMKDGRRPMAIRLNRRGRRLLSRRPHGLLVRLEFVATDLDGAVARDMARTRLVRPRHRRD